MHVWFKYDGQGPDVEVGPRGFVIGRGGQADLDLMKVSNRLSGKHCSFWKVGGKYAVLDQKSTNGTYVGQVAEAEAAKEPVGTGVILIEIADEPNGPVLLAVRKVKEANLDLARDWIFLVSPDQPDGHVRIRFIPVPNGDFNMEFRACKQVRIVKKGEEEE